MYFNDKNIIIVSLKRNLQWKKGRFAREIWGGDILLSIILSDSPSGGSRYDLIREKRGYAELYTDLWYYGIRPNFALKKMRLFFSFFR